MSMLHTTVYNLFYSYVVRVLFTFINIYYLLDDI